MKKDIKAGHYELIEYYDYNNTTDLIILNENNQVRIVFTDFENMLTGGTVLDIWELYDMKTEEFNNFLNHVYYYNCDNPIEN